MGWTEMFISLDLSGILWLIAYFIMQPATCFVGRTGVSNPEPCFITLIIHTLNEQMKLEDKTRAFNLVRSKTFSAIIFKLSNEACQRMCMLLNLHLKTPVPPSLRHFWHTSVKRHPDSFNIVCPGWVDFLKKVAEQQTASWERWELEHDHNAMSAPRGGERDIFH